MTHEQIVEWLIREKEKDLKQAEEDLKNVAGMLLDPVGEEKKESARYFVNKYKGEISFLKYLLELFEEYVK